MIDRIRITLDKLQQSNITRHVVTLGLGSFVSQLIPIAASLILSRIYSPKAYGDWGIFVSYTGILIVLVSGKYELAILRPSRKVGALNLVVLSTLLAFTGSFCFFLLLYLLCFLMPEIIIPGLNYLPLYVFMTCLIQIYNGYANRTEQYDAIARSSISRSLSQAGSRIILGGLRYESGLIIGALLGTIAGIWSFVKKIHIIRDIRRSFSFRYMCKLAHVYRYFPFFQMPSALLNSLSTNLPLILMAFYFNKDQIGCFSMAITLLYLPVTLISNSLGQIFYKKASDWPPEDTAKLAHKFLKLTFPIGLTMSLFLIWGGEHLLGFLLGNLWSTTGLYAAYLSPWIWLILCFSPLGMIFDALDKQKTEMILNICLFVSRIVVIIAGGSLLAAHQTILLYGVVGTILWSLEGYIIYRLIGIRITTREKRFAFIFISIVLLSWSIKIWYTF